MMIREYCRLILFTFGLLIGLQIPSFIDQYEKRVDAYLLEAKQDLSGFQKTADAEFSGNIKALIQYYKNSQDPIFHHDGHSINLIYQHFEFLQKESASFNKPWYSVAFHVLSRYNSPFFKETMSDYSYNIPLKKATILWGLALAFLIAFIVEGISLLLIVLLKLLKKKITTKTPQKEHEYKHRSQKKDNF